MSNLSKYWEEYQKIEQNGERTRRCYEIEGLIHEEQKKMGVSRYDFNVRWERKEAQKKPTLSGPSLDPTPEPDPVPTSNFSFDYAKKKLGDNDFNILEECMMDAEVLVVCAAKIANIVNVENKTNHARRGMVSNIGIRLYEEKKKLG